MIDVDQIYRLLGGDSGAGVGFSYGLTGGNKLEKQLNTPNLWGHNPSETNYVPAAATLTAAIEDLIAGATRSVDISTLYHFADGYFLSALKNGLKRARASGNIITFRMIGGLHYPYHTPIDLKKELISVIQSLECPEDIPVYVAGMQTGILSMNHAKLVVVDGCRAICGGHNMWSVDYNEFAPAHDFSMQISGPGVAIAEGYLNEVWTRLIASKEQDNLNTQAKPLVFASKKSFMGEISDGALPHIDNPRPEMTGTTRALAVARMGRNLMPDQARGYDASHFAKLAAASMCVEHIRITTPWLGGSAGGIFDDDLLQILCGKIIAGVEVSIVMSEHGGTTSNGDIYYGESIETSAKRFVARIQSMKTFPKEELIQLLDSKLHIAPIRIFDKQPGDPAAKSWMWKNGTDEIEPANHAKTYTFDGDAFYFGSDNAYAIPENNLGLQEFGYLVSGAEETQSFLDNYWSKGWQYSSQFEFKDWNKIVR